MVNEIGQVMNEFDMDIRRRYVDLHEIVWGTRPEWILEAHSLAFDINEAITELLDYMNEQEDIARHFAYDESLGDM